MEVKGLSIKNYKAIKELDTPAWHKTLVIGKNGVGKTTIADAITDILCDKMTDGTSTTSIRPHDNDGNYIHNVPIVREIQAEINGKVYAIRKTTEEKWRRPHGANELVYDGTKTTYSIDGFEKQLKEFTEWMTDHVAKPETIAFLMNPQVFINALRKSTTEARKTLEKVSGFSVEKFVAEHQEYAEIAELIGENSIEDALKQFRKNYKIQKTALEDERKKLSYEKDRALDLVDVDESRIAVLEKEIADIDEKIKLAEEYNLAQKKLYADASDKLTSLMCEKQKFEADCIADMRNAEMKAKEDLFEAMKNSAGAEGVEMASNLKLNQLTEQYRAYEKELKEAMAVTINDTCHSCGQKLPADKVEHLQKAQLDKCNVLKAKLDETKKSGSKWKKEHDIDAKKVDEFRAIEKEMQKALEDVQSKMAAFVMPAFDKQDEIDGLKKQMEDIYITTTDPLYEESREKKSEIATIREKMALNDSIKERKAKLLAELECSVKSLANACGSIEQKIDTIMHFSIDKNKALADAINPYFNHFYFKFLEFTEIEGNPVETCRLIEKATNTDYMNGLNHGSRIICEAELVAGFQKLNNIELPVILDDSESVDTDKIPQLSQQMFVLRRVDDEPLTVKEF